ncbi:MAG: PhoD-like phosphatase N-terminal domain-containing protein, partial [Actinobacteria bacterium]|nr:PhoD-like phosphatase N-terminal domain-containing protein [Actinomycetota bacterium]
MTGAIGRRQFLTGAAAAAAALAVGCSSDSEGAARTTGPSTTAMAAPTTSSVPDLATDPFTLGVASGDPLTDRVILWTRLAPDPLADDGRGGMGDDPVEVVWEVAADDAFESLVATGVAVAEAAHGHAVHVDATGLAPGTDYRYRFTVGSYTSTVG